MHALLVFPHAHLCVSLYLCVCKCTHSTMFQPSAPLPPPPPFSILYPHATPHYLLTHLHPSFPPSLTICRYQDWRCSPGFMGCLGSNGYWVSVSVCCGEASVERLRCSGYPGLNERRPSRANTDTQTYIIHTRACTCALAYRIYTCANTLQHSAFHHLLGLLCTFAFALLHFILYLSFTF